jgi:predicted unusual protein kinase regulating ubiquinone biosynthesis (AarF/ABC1/UbiB family)
MMTMNDNDIDLREKLNDSVPSMPYEEVLDQISKAYGAPGNTVFKSLEKTGDSASLGQVYFGKLKSGTAVAVKIQYPEIGSSVETELELMG